MSENRKKNIGRLALFGATLIWGLSFVFMKTALDSMGALYILAFRFLGASVILVPFCLKKKINKGDMLGGAAMGAALAAAYIFQTYGLKYTTPGKNAFLTSIYCVLVPFLYWLIIRRRPDKFNVAAAFICIAGMGFISLEGSLGLGLGDALTIVCGFFFALHIVITAGTVGRRDPVLLTMLQFAAAGVISAAGALIFEQFPKNVSADALFLLSFLAVVSTAICLFLQIFGQKYTPPAQAAVIMALEAVFGAASSVILLGEGLTARLVIGFIFTFAAVIISETKLKFIPRRENN